MARQWHVDEGLAVLIAQWKREHPRATVYTIADGQHSQDPDVSQHAPEPSGEVDAGDFMPGNGVTEADLAELRAALIHGRDPRLLMIIWHKTIVSSVVAPWVVRQYGGKYHGHLHVSVNDRFGANRDPWDLEDEVARTYTMRPLGGSVPELRAGDEDQPGKVQHITRVQGILNAVYGAELEIDGVYGAKTASWVQRVMKDDDDRSSTTGAKLYVPEWRRILGVW